MPALSSTVRPLLFRALQESFRYAIGADRERKALFQRVRHFRDKATEKGVPILKNAHGPIQGIEVEGNETVLNLEHYLWKEGFAVKAIRKPTVPEGRERLRIVLHADTPLERIDHLIQRLKERI